MPRNILVEALELTVLDLTTFSALTNFQVWTNISSAYFALKTPAEWIRLRAMLGQFVKLKSLMLLFDRGDELANVAEAIDVTPTALLPPLDSLTYTFLDGTISVRISGNGWFGLFRMT